MADFFANIIIPLILPAFLLLSILYNADVKPPKSNFGEHPNTESKNEQQQQQQQASSSEKKEDNTPSNLSGI